MKYLIVFTASILFSLNSFSAIDMYLKVSGISGGSTNAQHKDWIDVLQYVDGAKSTVVNGQPSKVSANEFSCVIYTDKALNQLRNALFTGKHLTNVQFEFLIPGVNGSQLYQQIYMESVVITSITGGLSGGEDRGTINISFCPAKFRYTYYHYDAQGVQSSNIFGWNIAENLVW